MTDETKFTHFVLAGGVVASKHTSQEDAHTAGKKTALSGKETVVTQLVETIVPNTGVTVTTAAGVTTEEK